MEKVILLKNTHLDTGKEVVGGDSSENREKFKDLKRL